MCARTSDWRKVSWVCQWRAVTRTSRSKVVASFINRVPISTNIHAPQTRRTRIPRPAGCRRVEWARRALKSEANPRARHCALECGDIDRGDRRGIVRRTGRSLRYLQPRSLLLPSIVTKSRSPAFLRLSRTHRRIRALAPQSASRKSVHGVRQSAGSPTTTGVAVGLAVRILRSRL